MVLRIVDERPAVEPVVVGQVRADDALSLRPVAGRRSGSRRSPWRRPSSSRPGSAPAGTPRPRRRPPRGRAWPGGAACSRHLLLVLRDERRPGADLVVAPVAEREHDGGHEDPRPPARQRVVVLLDAVVARARAAGRARPGSCGGLRDVPAGRSSAERQEARPAERLAIAREERRSPTTVTKPASAITSATWANRLKCMRAHHVGELHRPVPSPPAGAAATAGDFLMSVPRRWRYDDQRDELRLLEPRRAALLRRSRPRSAWPARAPARRRPSPAPACRARRASPAPPRRARPRTTRSGCARATGRPA